MIFIIGGSDQGKRAFARETLGLSEDDFLICSEDTREIDFRFRCIAHIERFALGCVQRGESPEDYWRAHLDRLGDKVLIADDISCGIVPVDPTMRAWREASGRANALLANRAERVWRVFCGLGQVIK